MKNIKDIASGGKFVQWESLAGPIDENFAELNKSKLSKDELAQTTGSSTTIPMSQDAITEALAGLLPNQRADKTPYISVVINDGDSGQNWETFNRTLAEIASMPDPMPYNGDIRYFISEGLRVDVTNRIFDSSEGASRRLTQVVTGNVRLDDQFDLALNGDADQSFWRIYKEGAWSKWKAVNSGGESDRIYFTSLDVTAIDNGATVSLDEAGELGNIQLALESKKTIISSAGVLAASVSYRRPSLIVSMSYVIGSELRILSTVTPKTGGGTWAVITKDMSTQSDIISVQGLSDIISSGTASKEDIERIFGTSDFDELSAKLLGKIIVDQNTGYADPYMASVLGNSMLGVITIARAGIKSTAPNYRSYIGISYAAGSFSKCSAEKVVTIEDAPSDNNIYGRKDGKWEPISKVYNELYRIPGRLSSISESTEAPELTSVLGPAQDLIGALSSGRPIASQQESDGVNEIFCYIPIGYRYNVDNNTCSFSYIIGTELYAFDIDLSDGYGDITNFKKKDLTA